MANDNFSYRNNGREILVGPESTVHLYFGAGMSVYNHVLIERPDLRDSFSAPEMPNPKMTSFDLNDIRIIGGLAIPLGLDETVDVTALVDAMRDEVGWNAEIIIAEAPEPELISKYDNQKSAREHQVDKIVRQFADYLDTNEFLDTVAVAAGELDPNVRIDRIVEEARAKLDLVLGKITRTVAPINPKMSRSRRLFDEIFSEQID